MLMMLSKSDVAATVTFGMKSYHLIEKILRCIAYEMLILSLHVFKDKKNSVISCFIY